MHIISKDTAELIQKADAGCIKSQMDVGIYYIGCHLLPDDPFMSAHYLSKFLEVPYHIIEANEHIEAEYYLQILILCGHNYVELKEYETALSYYNRVEEFADTHLTPDQSKPLMKKHDFYEMKELIEDFLNEKYDAIDSEISYHC